ncbi:MAG: hypothetical protein ACP5K8_00905 [Nitrososphaeria archaeon]
MFRNATVALSIFTIVLAMFSGVLDAKAFDSTVSPKWVKTIQGYLDAGEVYMDGSLHITTYTEEPYAAYYARISPFGHIREQYRIRRAEEVYTVSLAKGRFAGVCYNNSNDKEFVNVYTWGGRLLWTLEEPENCYYTDAALTKYGNLYILMANESNHRAYLIKYDSRFNKVYTKEVVPSETPFGGYYYPYRLFVGGEDDVYTVIGYWRLTGFWCWVSEVQKFSSGGERVWARIFSGTSSTVFSSLYYQCNNIREVSGKIFVGVSMWNATNPGWGWIYSCQGFLFMLDRETGSIVWQHSFPEIMQGDSWPYLYFDIGVSSNRVYALYSQGYSWETVAGSVIVLDFSGNILSAYSLNLPIPASNVWIIRATREGQVYLLGSKESYTYIMGLGKIG